MRFNKNWILIVFLLLSSLAKADFTVAPVSAILSQKQRIITFNVKSNWTTPTRYKIELVRWQQVDGKDVYTPSRDLLIAPPTFQIPANETRIFRLALKRAPESQELAYRLYIQKLPDQADNKSPAEPEQSISSGIKILFRFSLPIFVSPTDEIVKKVEWRVTRNGANQIKLTAHNIGNVHTTFTNLILESPTNTKSTSLQLKNDGAMLPNTTKNWTLTLPSSIGNQVKLTAHLADGSNITELLTIGA